MGKYRKLTSIEILLILAIIAILVVWLFPRLLKTLDFNSSAIGIVTPYIGDASGSVGLNKLQVQYVNATQCWLSSFKVSGIDHAEL
jgi:hypothetical protein